MRKNVPVDDNVLTESEDVFEKAAEVFRHVGAHAPAHHQRAVQW